MDVLLIAAIILLYSFQTLFCTMYTERYPGRKELASPVFCILESVCIAVFTLCWIGFDFQAAPLTLLFGVLNAAVLFGYNTSLIKAGATGSYAFMNVMMLFGGILVPLVYSVAFLGNAMTVYQWIAIPLMLVSFVLMNLKEMRLKGSKPVFYLYCAVLFLTNGLYGTLLKMQSIYHEDQKNAMVILTFAIMGVIAFVQLAMREKKHTFAAFRMNKKALWPLILCLASAALAINMLVLVIPMIDEKTLYTVENGGVLVVSALYSFFIFKEKPNLPKVLGIILATVSITILSK